MFLRRKVGISKSCPSTIVGSLFSKRPRVTGSNCIIFCFAQVFCFFAGFGAPSSITGFFFGGIRRGADFLIDGFAGAGGSSTGAGWSNGMRSFAVFIGIAGIFGSGTISIFGANEGGGASSTCSRMAGSGARNGSGIGGGAVGMGEVSDQK